VRVARVWADAGGEDERQAGEGGPGATRRVHTFFVRTPTG
jgi:hypothetical protein